MDDHAKRLVRCPICRLHFETQAAQAVCTVCGKIVEDETPGGFEDETPEKAPTRKLAIIPPRK
jgi:hypothetical protein